MPHSKGALHIGVRHPRDCLLSNSAGNLTSVTYNLWNVCAT
jgi:hypothetical protein